MRMTDPVELSLEVPDHGKFLVFRVAVRVSPEAERVMVSVLYFGCLWGPKQ